MVKQKRVRTDTFWRNSAADNAQFFESILSGTNESYYIDEQADINLDYNGKKRECWRVYSKQTGQPVTGLRSTEPYRLALVWAALSTPKYFKEARHRELKAKLHTIDSKRGKHSRHRCPNGWCCRPCHIQIGSREKNEQDKHFHFFLRKTEEGISKRFMDEFRSLCRDRRVWGFYPVVSAQSSGGAE
ncbi:MAG: HNH endonuclease family protein [Acidimicrobiales bacterium]